MHMGRVLSKLFAHPAARAVTVFPLSVRSPSSTVSDAAEQTLEYWLIYPELISEGFRTGTPDRKYISFEEVRAMNDAGSQSIHGSLPVCCATFSS